MTPPAAAAAARGCKVGCAQRLLSELETWRQVPSLRLLLSEESKVEVLRIEREGMQQKEEQAMRISGLRA